VTIIETGYAKSGTPEDKISVARPWVIKVQKAVFRPH
jgi:hypothetical protein